MTADVSMAVLVTLVFSDEAHREAWLVENGFVPSETTKRTVGLEGRDVARRLDYEHRASSQNLVYSVGPLEGGKYCRPEDER